MEQKRNLVALIVISAVVYTAYLIILYHESGGTMTVTYNPPEWTFGLFVGAFIFVIGLAGGVVGLSLTRPDLLGEGTHLRQVTLLAAGLGGVSAVMAVLMVEGYNKTPALLILPFTFIGLWIVYAKRSTEKLKGKAVVVDERERLIELKSTALAGDVLLFIVAVGFLISSFTPLRMVGTRSLLFGLLAMYLFTWLIARLYYQRVM